MRKGMGVALLIFGLDQATKWWIVESVMVPPQMISVTPFFNLVMGWNRGVSFGLFNQDSPYNVLVLTAVALIIVVALVFWLRKAERQLVVVAIGMVIGGAIGNVVDRLRFGAVADFLDFHIAGYHWPAFNVADSGITIGAGLLVLDALFSGPEKNNNKTPEATKD
ncbi:MAG: signal peptidase II [Rhodospirillales bacterium]|nr:signal peptidase II [Rhodospirillales bacterium]